MHEDVIKFERRGTIAILTFNRPKVLNAFNNNLMERTIETVKILNEDDDVRIIVVQGAGRAFSPVFTSRRLPKEGWRASKTGNSK